jgi:hypothetical protein
LIIQKVLFSQPGAGLCWSGNGRCLEIIGIALLTVDEPANP